MDTKSDEFIAYLHSTDTINALKEALASLYRLESWPANPIEFICQKLSSEESVTMASLANELDDLRKEELPEEDLGENLNDEIKEDIEKANEKSGDESEMILIRPDNDASDNQENEGVDQESIQESILIVEDLDQEEEPVNQEDKTSENEKSNELEQEVKEPGISMKKPINRLNKNRKHKNLKKKA